MNRRRRICQMHGAAGPVDPPGPLTLLRDTFSDSDTTPLGTHAMDVGDGWTESAGDWIIAGNRAQLVSELLWSPNWATADAGTADFAVQVDVTHDTLDPGGRSGLCLRQGGDSLWELYFAEGGSDEIELWENNAGSRSLKQKTTYLFDNGDTLTLRAEAEGDAIAVYINGDLQFTAIGCTLNQTATRCGLWSWGVDPTAHRWDNFEVTG